MFTARKKRAGCIFVGPCVDCVCEGVDLNKIFLYSNHSQVIEVKLVLTGTRKQTKLYLKQNELKKKKKEKN